MVLGSATIMNVTPVNVWKLWRSKPSACNSWMPPPPGTGESWAEIPHIPNQLLARRSLSLKSTGGIWIKSCRSEEQRAKSDQGINYFKYCNRFQGEIGALIF